MASTSSPSDEVIEEARAATRKKKEIASVREKSIHKRSFGNDKCARLPRTGGCRHTPDSQRASDSTWTASLSFLADRKETKAYMNTSFREPNYAHLISPTKLYQKS